MISTISHSEEGGIMETVKGLVVAGAGGRDEPRGFRAVQLFCMIQ